MASISASRTEVGAGATPPLLRLISLGSRTYALRILFQNSSSPARSSGATCTYARFKSEASTTASAPYRNSRRLTSALILMDSHHSFRPQAYRNRAAFGDLLGPFSLPRLTPPTRSPMFRTSCEPQLLVNGRGGVSMKDGAVSNRGLHACFVALLITLSTSMLARAQHPDQITAADVKGVSLHFTTVNRAAALQNGTTTLPGIPGID